MKDIEITVSGINAEYITISPSNIGSLLPGETKDLKIKINAPAYFTANKYTLTFNIAGKMDYNGTLTDFLEAKAVTLYIVEVSSSDAGNMLNESILMIEEMNQSNMIVKDVDALFAKLNDSFNKYDFTGVKNYYEQIKTIYDSAFESKKLLDELRSNIQVSEKNGISVSETKKLLYIAEVIYNRGDYSQALERLKEAKLTFGLETKGEFNLLYSVKNNPIQTLGIILLIGVVGTGSTVVLRFQLNKKKLKILQQEEVLLLELMKVIQRECFENNHMSMEEYEQAMAQYENRLSETIANKIKVETVIANILKIRGKHRALVEEKKRLIELVKGIQDDYLNKNKIETRVYENMMKSYTARLSEVDEQLAFLDAQDALNKESKLRRMFRV